MGFVLFTYRIAAVIGRYPNANPPTWISPWGVTIHFDAGPHALRSAPLSAESAGFGHGARGPRSLEMAHTAPNPERGHGRTAPHQKHARAPPKHAGRFSPGPYCPGVGSAATALPLAILGHYWVCWAHCLLFIRTRADNPQVTLV